MPVGKGGLHSIALQLSVRYVFKCVKRRPAKGQPVTCVQTSCTHCSCAYLTACLPAGVAVETVRINCDCVCCCRGAGAAAGGAVGSSGGRAGAWQQRTPVLGTAVQVSWCTALAACYANRRVNKHGRCGHSLWWHVEHSLWWCAEHSLTLQQKGIRDGAAAVLRAALGVVLSHSPCRMHTTCQHMHLRPSHIDPVPHLLPRCATQQELSSRG